MPLLPFNIEPGLVTEATERGARNRWVDADKVRFRKGWPEKIGGWQLETGESEEFDGVARSILGWTSIDQVNFFGIGTSEKLYIRSGGLNSDITPYQEATDAFGGTATELTDPFETTNGSNVVTVNHTSHGLTVNTWIEFTGAATVGGLDMNDTEWQVTEVLDSDTYQFEHTDAATGSATGGGTVDFAYWLAAGQQDQTAGFGYGSGTWSASTYGTSRQGLTTLPPRIWSLDTWGQLLIANPNGGKIYSWNPDDGVTTRASAIANAPDENLLILVSDTDRHLIAIGTVPVGETDLDPLVIRWCDQNNFNDWTPDITNTSGQRRLDDGNRFIAALRGRREHLIFTDTSLYAMTFVGPPAIFGIKRVGKHGGILGQKAAAEYNGVVYWMGLEDFFVYDGRVRILDCPVRNHVFDDINRNQRLTFFAGINSRFTEVWWFYASAGSSDIDRYVIFNFNEGTWTFGTLARTAWDDRSEATSVPVAMARDNGDSKLYFHEVGYADESGAMDWHLESYDAELPEMGNEGGPGGYYMRVRKMIPDFFERDEDITVTMKARKYPNLNSQQVSKSVTMTPTDNYIKLRLRGRQIAIRLDGSSEKFWRAGNWRVDAFPHGGGN